MKFTQFKEYRGVFNGDTLASLFNYLSNEMPAFLRELSLGLNKLSFVDNFNAFKTTITIEAGQELAIRNQLRSKEIPNERIIVRGKSGIKDIVDGDTDWTSDYVYLKNLGGSAVSLTVVFIKG